MRISDWSSDVCSSDLLDFVRAHFHVGVKNRRPLHDIAQFADIAWPVVGGKHPERGFGKRRSGIHLLKEMGDEFGQVLAAFGKGGQMERENVEEIGRGSCREMVCQYV